MTSNELIEKAFSSNEVYSSEQIYDFNKDSNFNDFLRLRFPFIWDFLNLCEVSYEYKSGLACAFVEKGIPKIFLNPDKITYIYQGVKNNLWPISVFYETLACLLWHEVLHIQLRHFSNLGAVSPKEISRINVAADIIVDNLIHSRFEGWRNWRETIEQINLKLEKSGKINFLRKISLDDSRENKIHISELTLSELLVYMNMTDFDAEESQKNRFDGHSNPNSSKSLSESKNKQEESEEGKNKGNPNTNDSKDSKGNKGEKDPQKIKDILIDKLEEEARKRNEKRNKMPFAQEEIGDLIAQKSGEGRRYSLASVLKKYVRKISLKNKKDTWKKISRKSPGLRPGKIYQKNAGEVLFAVDTSGSMVDFITEDFSALVDEIYSVFKYLAKINGSAFSKFFKIDSDSQIRGISSFKDPEELKKSALQSLKGGGGTDYKPVFDFLLDSKKKKLFSDLPDLILFLTDLECDLDFLRDSKYSVFANKVVWLYCRKSKPFAVPPIGEICRIFPDDFGANEPYYKR